MYASYTVVMLRLKRAAGAEVGHGLYLESFFAEIRSSRADGRSPRK